MNFAGLTLVKKKTTKHLRQPTKDDLQHGFEQCNLKMPHCVQAEGEYMEEERY